MATYESYHETESPKSPCDTRLFQPLVIAFLRPRYDGDETENEGKHNSKGTAQLQEGGLVADN